MNHSTYYDHASVENDPASSLRDALKALGFSVTLAHTGGGCMSVDVILNDERHALVGVDEPLSIATSGGFDLYDESDRVDPYVRSGNFGFAAGGAVDAIAEWIRGEGGIARPERKATVSIVIDEDGEMAVFGLPEGATVEVLDFQWGDTARQDDPHTENIEYDPLDGGAFVRYTPHTDADFPRTMEAS